MNHDACIFSSMESAIDAMEPEARSFYLTLIALRVQSSEDDGQFIEIDVAAIAENSGKPRQFFLEMIFSISRFVVTTDTDDGKVHTFLMVPVYWVHDADDRTSKVAVSLADISITT